MLPQSTTKGHQNGSGRYATLLGKNLGANTAISFGSYFSNGFFRKFCVSIIRSLGCFIATLLHHVEEVVSLRSKKQVMRVYAAWIVAAMQNELTFWNWSKVDFPRNTMGSFHGSTRPAGHNTIPGRRLSGRYPDPTATVILGYLFPKALSKWSNLSHVLVIPCSSACGGKF